MNIDGMPIEIKLVLFVIGCILANWGAKNFAHTAKGLSPIIWLGGILIFACLGFAIVAAG